MTQEEWWEEDAERLNALCDTAHKLGKTVAVGAAAPPALHPDGALNTNAFNPDQPRDSDGKFSGGEGGADQKGYTAGGDAFSGSKVKQPKEELGDTGSFQGGDDSKGPMPERSGPQKQFPHLAHLLNGTKQVHATGLTQKAALEKVKELRGKGVNAASFKDPKTGKRFVVNFAPGVDVPAANGESLDDLLEGWGA